MIAPEKKWANAEKENLQSLALFAALIRAENSVSRKQTMKNRMNVTSGAIRFFPTSQEKVRVDLALYLFLRAFC